MITIKYTPYERRSPRYLYYEAKFKDFRSCDITVSERSPMSPKHGGYAARRYWRVATEEEARRTSYSVWFKNSSLYGASKYYINDRLDR